MFAVIKTGGKQYKVSKEEVVVVEKLSANTGDLIQFNDILLVVDGKVEIGAPILGEATVRARVLDQIKDKKVISFVKRRRKNSSKRTKGHRQNKTVVKVTDIVMKGVKGDGTKIENGVTLIESAKPAPAVKTVPNKKAAPKTGSTKEVAAKSSATKEAMTETSTSKREVEKADTAYKATKKKEPTNKVVGKTEPTKKAAGKTEPTKKAAGKTEPTKKVARKTTKNS